jgi:hypothetical protein
MAIVSPPADLRWQPDGERGIVWNVQDDTRLPHEDHVEMSGRRVSVITRYGADAEKRLTLSREVIWPMLRLQKEDVRGYLRRTYGGEVAPRLTVDGQEFAPGPLARIRFDGVLTFEHKRERGLQVTRALFPSTRETQVIEAWTVRNVGREPVRIEIAPLVKEETDRGVYGEYAIETALSGPASVKLWPRDAVHFGLLFRARRAGETIRAKSLLAEERDRRHFAAQIARSLRLETPDPILNRAFDMAKLRAAESVFETKMGLVHSPGGGRYYGGIWANDQAEYSGPFFPFLGDRTANEAALNACRIFARAMTPEFEMLPSSFEVEGDVRFHAGGDRGDAAMVAYGASRFALARGDRKIGAELWTAVEWCLEYCRRKTNADGVVESDTDELEGRFPTGRANLSTSALCYGGLRAAADLARALDKSEAAQEYDARADALRQAMERYFGAEVEGFPTYRYYAGNTVLRAWICLPLVMGLMERREGTILALFSPRLWTPDGLATQAGDETFWDRSTLYALRGVFAAGETETALRYLTAYTRRRLLGDHVPYPVEAWPEGGQAHLSAESALYCRILTEGLFGITPTGFRSFRCLPRLPERWPRMALRRLMAFGGPFDLLVERDNGEIRLTVRAGEKTLFSGRRPAGEAFEVVLP